ncbi:hypothetical protein C1Y40_04909 [Mycobacterium talmoniae]|uniref:Uncharacterized protein n=1 Tax=Mycobacterium talmoniae TaxID=1858794 RepID=A0A2S8BE33_9MYCO|nr:hypothetical protein C1Y40_04909 [Mycobacterium talmoniae]
MITGDSSRSSLEQPVPRCSHSPTTAIGIGSAMSAMKSNAVSGAGWPITAATIASTPSASPLINERVNTSCTAPRSR